MTIFSQGQHHNLHVAAATTSCSAIGHVSHTAVGPPCDHNIKQAAGLQHMLQLQSIAGAALALGSWLMQQLLR
jgi:hypothetical protein